MFGKNRKLLSSINPSLLRRVPPPESSAPYRLTRNPKLNILLGDRSFHSRTDPENEAARLVQDLNVQEGSVYLFLGIGLGYHIQLFKERYAHVKGVNVIAVERSAEAFALLLAHRDASFLQGIQLHVAESPEEVELSLRMLESLSFRGYRIVRLRGSCALFPGYYDRIESAFKQIMAGKLSDLLTRFAFETLWMKNIVKNLPYLCGNSSITPLRGWLSRKPAMVIAAGPSLRVQLDRIRRLSSRVHIIASDTALEPLLLGGIIPDFIVTLDGQYFTLSHFHSLLTGTRKTSVPILVADVVSQPSLIKQWPGRIFFSAASARTGTGAPEVNPIVQSCSDHRLLLEPLPCGGSVATTALEFALFLGAEPVYLTGLDLAYTYFSTHVSDSANMRHFAQNACRTDTMLTRLSRAIAARRLCRLDGIDGNTVLSDFVFRSYLQWFSGRKEYSPRVINTTAHGAKIPGLAHISLEELLGKGVRTTDRRLEKRSRLPHAAGSSASCRTRRTRHGGRSGREAFPHPLF